MHVRLLMSAVICSSMALSSLPAQSVPSAAGPLRVGLSAGLNSTTFGGSDADGADRRNGFIGGVYLVKPFADGLAIRPELLFAQKGAETSVTVTDSPPTKLGVRVTYVELPVLLQLEQATTTGIRPHAYAGPSIGLNLGCSIGASSGGASSSIDCDELDEEVKKLELAGVIGAGIGFPVGPVSMTVGARYQHGFTDIEENAKVQNRALSFYGSLEFPHRSARPSDAR